MKTSLALFWTAVHASVGLAQSPTTFTAIGSMITPRVWHTTTLLPNGKVLIAGGQTGLAVAESSATAEVYDPATGAFSATGNMITARNRHNAILLPDGRVLIAGGVDDRSVSVATAEIYDPSAGTFTEVADSLCNAPYSVTTATLLTTGNVLITCGTIAPMPPLADTAFLYNPGTGARTGTGDLIWNHAGPVAVLLSDGKVLIVEGRDPACETTNQPIPCGGSEIYNPSSGTFSPTNDVRGAPWRAGALAALLINGQVLVAGGDGGNDLLKTADLYQPSSGFIATSDMSISRGYGLNGILLPDGSVLISGGGSMNIGITATAEIYDASLGTFHRVGAMSTPRDGHATVLLPDGSVLTSGGFNGAVLASVEVYHPAVLIPPPALISVSGDGHGQGAIQHGGMYQLVTPDNPAIPGETILIYCTGLANSSVIPPQVTIGGRFAEVQWFGSAPGFMGLNQINVRVPSGIDSGVVPVRLNYIGRPSNEVTIDVR